MNLLKKVAGDPSEKRSHNGASYNDLSTVFTGLLGRGLEQDDSSRDSNIFFSLSDIGKLYSFAVFAAPSYLHETRLSQTKDLLQKRKKEFQEYLRVSLSYVSLEQDLKKHSVQQSLLDNAVGTPSFVHSKDTLVGLIVSLLNIDASEKTYEHIGKAVVKGADIYSRIKQKERVSVKAKYKMFSEYNLIQKQLEKLVQVSEE